MKSIIKFVHIYRCIWVLLLFKCFNLGSQTMYFDDPVKLRREHLIEKSVMDSLDKNGFKLYRKNSDYWMNEYWYSKEGFDSVYVRARHENIVLICIYFNKKVYDHYLEYLKKSGKVIHKPMEGSVGTLTHDTVRFEKYFIHKKHMAYVLGNNYSSVRKKTGYDFIIRNEKPLLKPKKPKPK